MEVYIAYHQIMKNIDTKIKFFHTKFTPEIFDIKQN